MANYLLVCLSSSVRSWLLGQPAGSVRSWNHLRWLFTSNFCATCAWPGVNWDLVSVVQKKGESLWEYIQCIWNKRNVILEVDDKLIVMFFKKGLRDSSLIRKLMMKNPKTSEQMFSIVNRYALAEEATSTQESRRRSQVTQINLAHPRATIRKESQTVRLMRLNGLVIIRSTGPGRVNSKAVWITFVFFTPKESTRPETATDSKIL
jgi:hypothetical protein